MTEHGEGAGAREIDEAPGWESAGPEEGADSYAEGAIVPRPDAADPDTAPSAARLAGEEGASPR